MNIPNGVKTTTIDNLEFEAGLILKTKFTTATAFNKEEDVLCSTTGGIKIAIAQNKQAIALDGIRENTAGAERIIGWTASVQFSTKEVDAEKTKLALGYAGITDSENKKTVDLKQGVVPATEYKDFYILGKMADGTWRQIIINKAMNVGGLQEQKNDKGETAITFDLQANYTLSDQDNPPVSIEFITEAQV